MIAYFYLTIKQENELSYVDATILLYENDIVHVHCVDGSNMEIPIKNVERIEVTPASWQSVKSLQA